MAESGRLSSVDDTPVYTIKTVVQQTGITPATLRAWERRYGALSPGRSDGGYRLYSERDIARLRWLKNQVDTGVSISSAVALLELQHKTGQQPEREPLTGVARTSVRGARNADTVTQGLLAALLAFQEMEAETILAEAFALYAIEDVAEEIIVPVLVEIGELWHRGEASIIQEHFATAFLRRRLSALFNAYDQPATGPLAIAGSASGEWHDVGILLVSLVLRRHGWRVIYLGQNVPAANLLDAVRRLRPNLVCLSATTIESLEGLTEVAGAIAELPNPRPRLALGGRVFHLQEELKARFPETLLVGSARELVTALARL